VAKRELLVVFLMAKLFAGSNAVAHKLPDLSELREATGLLVREEYLPIQSHLEDTAATGDHRHLGQLLLECGEEFLGQPGGS